MEDEGIIIPIKAPAPNPPVRSHSTTIAPYPQLYPSSHNTNPFYQTSFGSSNTAPSFNYLATGIDAPLQRKRSVIEGPFVEKSILNDFINTFPVSIKKCKSVTLDLRAP